MPRVRNALKGLSSQTIKGDEAKRQWPLAKSVVDSFGFHRSALRHRGKPFPARDTGWLYRRYTKPQQNEATIAAGRLFDGLGAGWERVVPKNPTDPTRLGTYKHSDSEIDPPWVSTREVYDWLVDVDRYFQPSITPITAEINLERAIRVGVLTNPQKLFEVLERHLNSLDGRADAGGRLRGLYLVLQSQGAGRDEINNLETALRVRDRMMALSGRPQ